MSTNSARAIDKMLLPNEVSQPFRERIEEAVLVLAAWKFERYNNYYLNYECT